MICSYLGCTLAKGKFADFMLTVGMPLNLPNGLFKVWQMDYIQLSPSHGYIYVLVMVHMFSHWVKVFQCR